MNKKKVLIIVIIVIIMLIFIKCFFFVNKTMYPKTKVVNNGNIKIACLGDSITYGLGVVDNRNKAWASILAKNLGDDYQTINYGLIGRTLISTGDMPYMKENLIRSFWKTNPNIIIFMLGTNDTKAINWNKNKFMEEYEEIVKKMLKEKNNSKLYIMIPPKIYINRPNKFQPNNNNLEKGVVPIIRNISKKYSKVELIDLYTFSLNHKEWFDDELHPNKLGNKKIADKIAKVIKNTYEER